MFPSTVFTVESYLATMVEYLGMDSTIPTNPGKPLFKRTVPWYW